MAPALTLYTPSQSDVRISRAEALGLASAVWAASPLHRHKPIGEVHLQLLPAIDANQYLLGIDAQGRPVAYVSWAFLDQAAILRHLHPPFRAPFPWDWRCGRQLWLIGWLVPSQSALHVVRFLRSSLFPLSCARAIRHWGSQDAPVVRRWRGSQVPADVALQWFVSHPLPDSLEVAQRSIS